MEPIRWRDEFAGLFPPSQKDLETGCWSTCMHSQLCLFATPETVAYHAPLPTGFPRQEYLSGLPFISLGDLSDSGIEPASPVSSALAGGFFTAEPPGKSYK